MSGKTKKELAKDRTITNQQSLIDAILPSTITPIKRLIPGGKTLLESLDKETMPKALYNQLKSCAGFSQVTISFAKEPERFHPTLTRVESYNPKDGKPFWDAANGRRELANKITNILFTHKRILYVLVKPDGIYIAQDTTNKFSPKVMLTEELQAEYPEFENAVIGDKVPSPDWEPFVEFHPTNRTKYSIFRT